MQHAQQFTIGTGSMVTSSTIPTVSVAYAHYITRTTPRTLRHLLKHSVNLSYATHVSLGSFHPTKTEPLKTCQDSCIQTLRRCTMTLDVGGGGLWS